MKKALMLILIISWLLLTVNNAFAFRCSGYIVVVGDRSFTILRKCGEPISKEVIGYTGEAIKLKIEEWVYGPVASYYIHLIFVAGRLDVIKQVHE